MNGSRSSRFTLDSLLSRFCLASLILMTIGVGQAWAWRGAKVVVYAQPNDGGKVYAGNSNSAGTYKTPSDEASQSNGKVSAYTFTFYIFAQANENYVFKGWASSENANSGDVSSPKKVSIAGNLTNYATEYYHAIFAKLTANKNSLSFGSKNSKSGWGNEQSVKVTYVHVGKLTASITGANASDFSFSNSSSSTSKTVVDNNTNTEASSTIKVYFNPSCNGTRTAKLTFSGNGMTKEVTLTGTGVLNGQTLSWDNESDIELSMLKGTTQTISATATSGLTVSYSSSNGSILSVDASGKLTANNLGTATITASQNGDCEYGKATSITKTFTVKSKDTPYFTPNWSNPNTTCDLLVGQSVKLAVSNVSAGLNGDLTATSSVNDHLHFSRTNDTITITAYRKGEVNAIIAQKANDTNFGDTVTYHFNVSLNEPTITVPNNLNMMVDGSFTASALEYSNVSKNAPDSGATNHDFYYTISHSLSTSVNKGNVVIAFNPSTKQIVAHNAGTATITIAQKETREYSAKSQSFNVAVYKYNSAFGGAANLGVKVEETKDAGYTLTYSKPNNAYIGNTPEAGNPSLNTGDYYYTLTQNVTSNNTTGSADASIAAAYNAGTKKATGKNAGTCTVNLCQKENYKFNAAQTSFEVTVTKNDPTFTWKAGPYYHNTTVNSVFSSSNTELDYTIGASTDAQVAYESGNKLYVLSKNGSAQFTVSQGANYKWNGKSQTYTVTPQNPSNHVTFTYTQAMYNDGNITTNKVSSYGTAWDDGKLRLGGSNTALVCSESTNWDDKYVDIKFLGIPEKVTFQIAVNSSKTTGEYWYVKESSNGSSWSEEKWSSEHNGTSFSSTQTVNLSSTTRYIRLCYSGNFAGYFKNIKVTELKKFAPDSTSLDFGANDINSTVASQTFDFNYANVGHNVTLSTDDSHFTVSPTSITNIGGEKTGKVTITVNYSTAEAHKTTNAKLTITDELGNSTNVTLKGETKKLTPSVTWTPNDSIFIEDDVLTATSNDLTVTLSVDKADEQYVYCEGNTATMLAAKEGTITITASVTGNALYESATFTKDITITNLTKQTISWDQNFSRLKTTDTTKTITLKATSSSNLPVSYKLEGDATGVSLSKSGNTWKLTYDTIECKNTTIVAMQGGDEEYAPAANVSKLVRVIDPKKKCDEELTLVHSTVTLKSDDATYNMDIPSEITIAVSRTKTSWAIYSNGFDVEFYDAADGKGNKLGSTHSYGAGDINTSKTITIKNLNIKTKSVKLISHASNGYNVNSVTYKKYTYCNVTPTSLHFATYPNTQTTAKTFDVSYANHPVTLECSNSKFAITPTSFGDCNDYDTQTVSVTYTAGVEEGKDTSYIYLKDNVGTVLNTCTLTVSISKVAQSITNHNIQTAYNTTDKVTLSAKTNSSATEKHFTYSAIPAGVASFDGNVMTFSQSGTISIIVREEGSDVYKPCADTVKNVVVSKVTPTLTLPTGTNATYLQNLNTSTLSGGKATVTLRSVENTEVDGSFAWTNGSTPTNGASGQSSFEVTFTPDDKGMYNSATGMVEITVNKANQSIVMNNGSVSVAVDKGLDANSDDSKLNLTSLIALQTADALDATRTGAVSFEVISENSTNATISGTIFSATAEGTYTVRATKAVTNYYNAATTEFTVTANVRTNSMSIAGACTRYVDQEVTNVLSNVNSDATIQTNSTAASIAYYDITTNKIIIPNSEAKSFNDTTITITIWQEATTQFAASGEKTIKVTVKKYDNTLNCDWGKWSKNMQFDEGTYVHFSSSNTDTEEAPIVVEQVTGLENATYYPATHAIYASHNIGDATWRVSQAETYLYKSAPAKTLTVKIDTIPMPTDCYVFNETAEHELFGVLGVGTGDPMELDAPGKDLYFEAKRDPTGANYFFIEYSTNGSQYTVLGDEVQLGTSYSTYGPYALPEGTTHIRFKTTTGATLTKHYKNVHVTRKTAFDLEDKGGAKISTMEMPLNIVSIDPLNVNSSKKSFWVDFNTCADVINVASNHPYYTVKEADKAFNASATNGAGRREIEVTYTCATADSSSAVISVYTQYEHRTITVKGRTDKGTQEILWKEPDFVNDTVSLPVGYSGTAGTTTSKLPLKYSIDSLHSDTGVICIANDEYSFEVKGLGTVTLIATQEGTATLYPVTGSRVIKVTTKKLQVIRWFQDLTNTLSEGDTVRLEAEVFVMNPATGTYVKDDARTDSIRYTHPENDNVIALMGKDSLRVIGVGETTITASAPGDDYYVEAPSITMNIHVHSLSDTCKNKLLVDSKKQYTFEPSIDWGFSNLNLTQAEYGDTIRINQSEGKPDKLSFEHCGEAFNILGKEYYQGYVKAQQHIRGAWVDVPGSRIAPAKGVWNTLKDIQLDEDADAILIMREENAYGTHYVKGVKVTMLPYLRADKEFYISAEAGTTVDTTITVEYANAKAALTAKTGRKENDTLSVRTSIFYPNCGTIGTYNWPIRFSSTKVGDWMDSITIKDSGSNDSIVIYVYATVTPGAVFVYENDTTNGAWGDDGNWGHGGDLPTADDHVIILSDVIIPADTTVYVKSITIDSASTVYVNGTLIVMESTPDQENYGNIHVADNGSLDLSNIAAGGVKINNFILDASLGDTTRSSSSGQATNADKLDLHGDAYFQMTFDPSGAITYGWYDFVVPFEVNIADGIFRQGETEHLIDGTDFIVMEHSEVKRAAGQKDWTVIHGTMFPGKVYTITFDADVNQNSFLFKKKATANISGSDAFNAVCSTGDDDKRGWNGLGNGTLQHMKLKGSGKKVQLYDHGSNVYVTREADDFNFAVGTSFFMQVDGAQTIELEAITDGSKPFLAPAAEGRNTDEFRLALKAENSSRVADQLWFSACEEATEAYVIGHDLLKMGTPTDAKSAQMWTTKGGKRLCDVEATLMNDNATTPLAFYAPKAGAYTLEVERAPKDADLYLTYNDQIIWDLTMSAFEFEVLPKGVTEGYGLRIEAKKAPEIATGVDSTEAEEKAMRKVIIDNKVYIITPEGKMYDVIGKCVKY